MPEHNRDERQSQIPQGFMDKMLDHMPKFVMGLVGSFIGIALAFVIVLKLGGVDIAFTRVINAYATSIEKSVDRIDVAADRIDEAMLKVTALAERVDAIQRAAVEQSGKADQFDARIKSAEQRIDAVEQWACGHERKVGKPAEFANTLCK